jgi:hypothetical protein
MAAPPSLLQMSFAAGLDESQLTEVLDPMSGFPVRQNCRQDLRGGASKRLGYGSLPVTVLGASDRSAGRRFFAHNGVPTVITATHLQSYVEAANTNVSRARVPECSYRVFDAPTISGSAKVTDTEVVNGYVAIAYDGRNDGGPAQAVIRDADTGAVVRGPETFGDDVDGDTGVALLTSFSSRYFVAFVRLASSGDLYAYRLDTQSLSSGWTLIEQVAAATSAEEAFSVSSLSSSVAVVYGTTSGTDRITVKTYGTTGTSLASTTISTSSTTVNSIDVHGSTAGTLWVCWAMSVTGDRRIFAIGLNPSTLAVVSTAANLFELDESGGEGGEEALGPQVRICEGSTNGTARILAASTTLMTMANLLTDTGATTAPDGTVDVYSALPLSRPFQEGGRYYIAVYGGRKLSTNEQAHLIVVDWTDDVSYLRPIANIEPGLVITPWTMGKFCESSNQWFHAFQTAKAGPVRLGTFSAGETLAGAQLLRLDFASRERWQTVSHANMTFVGGALLSVFDGEIVTEAGILVRPPKVNTSLVAPGGSGISGDYKYVAIYEDTDAAGNWVVSGISDPTDTVTATSDDVQVSIKPLSISSRIARGATRITLYRTLDGAEPPYYRVDSTQNDPENGIHIITDSMTDANLSTKAKLYAPNLPGTAGESLDRRAPPGLVQLESYNGMLVGARGESIFWSGQQIYGESTWFSPVFELPVPGGGRITAIKAQDGTLYIFKEDRIFAVGGEAPSDNGLAGGFGNPRLLACDVGCVDAASLVVTSLGLFFRSRRGLELLSRGGGVVWVGDKVVQTLEDYPVITSAVLDDRNGLVRISLAEAEADGVVSGDGRDVVYDLTLQTWISVDDKTGSSSHQASQDAAVVVVDGVARYAWLGSNGVVYYEKLSTDATAHLDGSTWITQSAETAVFKAGGIQGRQMLNRVLAMLRKHTDHNLLISLSYNYSENFETATTWTRAVINTLLSDGWPITQVKHDPHDGNECEGVRVRIEDATPTGGTVGTGKGGTWIALTLDVTPQPGLFDVPEAAA